MGFRLKGGAVKARDAARSYCAVSALLFALGLVSVVFMVVLCLRRASVGSVDMLLLLDAMLLLLLLALLASYGRMRRICRKAPGYACAAVDRRPDGGARIEFSVDGTRYVLDVPKEASVPQAGMVNLWYDPACPRHIFLEKKPAKPSLRCPACAGALLLLGGLLNVVFFFLL
ncbi:MAG: hypothetical protein VB055_09315 [Oscillospiraceae bacterium]|nr:hypothetical protein [Oscillospiraceae bacterium]